MKNAMIRRALTCFAVLAAATPALAQSEPYKVFDTKPVITEGPYEFDELKRQQSAPGVA